MFRFSKNVISYRLNNLYLENDDKKKMSERFHLMKLR